MTIISVENDFVLRDISNILSIDDFNKLFLVIQNNKNINEHIIDTKFQSVEKSVLKHRKIKHIIHSSEFTESMAYDVTDTAISMALDFIKYGIFANDLLAHNFTFENGKWILYDFCSFSYNKKGLRAQIRSTFYISFAAFELMKIIKRNKLKHYFLNRIKYSRLIKMISFFNWTKWYLCMEFILLLLSLNFSGTALIFMKKIFDIYNNKHKRNVYKFVTDEEKKKIYELIDNLLSENSDVFCVGKFSGDWALFSKIPAYKVFYTDNYELCDNYYNFIIQNNIKNISPAVLQPLSNDEALCDNLKYRALYDDYTKQRFASDTILIDFDEVYDEKYKSPDEFCSVISDYAKNCIIIKLSKNKILLKQLSTTIKKYFKFIESIELKENYLLSAKCNTSSVKLKNISYYGNDNRAKEQKKQCNAIIKLIKNN